MDAGDLRTVEMLIAEATRYLRTEIEQGFAMLRAELTPVADAAAVALETIIDNGPEVASEETPDGSAESSEDRSADVVSENDDSGGEIEVTEGGDILMETAEVAELTPQEALDAIQPSRTHPLLRKVGVNIFGIRS